jgi:hypothetical protein
MCRADRAPRTRRAASHPAYPVLISRCCWVRSSAASRVEIAIISARASSLTSSGAKSGSCLRPPVGAWKKPVDVSVPRRKSPTPRRLNRNRAPVLRLVAVITK